MANLLIVEDDPSLLAGMKDALTFERHQVRAVSSGRAALEAIEAAAPDLVISDLLMPGITGLQLLEEVRACPDGEAIPFLFVSASVGLDTKKQIADLDNVSFLRKPFEIEMLLDAVADAAETRS